MIDVTERKRAEEARDRLRQLESELAHINRVSTLGEMAASLAHEIKQPHLCCHHQREQLHRMAGASTTQS
jgi:C4-dicarboxylate-specific signal transduction histidine kinase